MGSADGDKQTSNRRALLLTGALAVSLVIAGLAWSAWSGSEASAKFCTAGLPVSTVDGVGVIARDNHPEDPRCALNGQVGEPDPDVAGVIELDCTITWRADQPRSRPATAPPLRADGTCGDGWDE